jgi:RNA polymerase sigma factor (sigma-70 family)
MQPRKDAGSAPTPALRRPDRLARRIRAAEAGDERAVRALLATVAPTTVRVVSLVLGPGCREAEDLAQESLVDFLRVLPPAADEDEMRHLAAFVALRRALEARNWSALAERILEVRPRPERRPASPRLARERRARLVSRVLSALPEEEAEVLGLRFLGGLTTAQITEMAGLPAVQVRRRLHAAKRALMSELTGDLDHFGGNVDAGHLHPEALRDLECEDRLSAEAELRLDEHRAECPVCALERDLAGDFSQRWYRPTGRHEIRVGRAVDAATAQWVWNVSRRMTGAHRRRRWLTATLAALLTATSVLGAAAWIRYRALQAQQPALEDVSADEPLAPGD